MVVCNILYDPKIDWDSDDGRVIAKYKSVPAINVITDITHFDTSVSTLVYGYKLAKDKFGDVVTMRNTKITKFHSWSYTNSEVSYENWIDRFVNESTEKWFKYVANGIDVVFDEFSVAPFVKHLNPWPLIHEGGYEIYIADWRDGEIIIHSIKKDTLEYIGVNVKEFIWDIYTALDFDFLTIDPKTFPPNIKYPIFLDLMLESNMDFWMGIDEIIDYYSNIKIDRPKVITYYLKQSEFLRASFNLYR